jgi:hypothetical protein
MRAEILAGRARISEIFWLRRRIRPENAKRAKAAKGMEATTGKVVGDDSSRSAAVRRIIHEGWKDTTD